MTRLIIIRGHPGSGKTTLGKALEGAGYGRFVDHNQILTFIASIAGDDDGIYDDIAQLEQAITRKLLRQGHDVIVARGFSSVSSMQPYVDIAQNERAKLLILRLDAPSEALAVRVQSIERHNDFNPTVTAEALDKWIRANPIEAVDDETLIDASQPVATVVERTIDVIDMGARQV